MKEISLTKNLFAIVDDEDFEWLSKFNWRFGCRGYVYRCKSKGRKIFIHREIIRPRIGFDVDHKNGNTLDNRRSNLRECTEQQNTWNRKVSKKNRSGLKGAYRYKNTSRFYSVIHIGQKKNKKVKYLGTFETAMEAHLVYCKAAAEKYGEFSITCRSNNTTLRQ